MPPNNTVGYTPLFGELGESDMEDVLLEKESGRAAKKRNRFASWNTFGVLIKILLVVIYSTALWSLASYWFSQDGCKPNLVYSPAEEALRFRKQRFDAELVIDSEYIGEPGEDVDAAWHSLLQNMNIAVRAADLERLKIQSISVPDEPGMFIAGLSVYHELHCLKRLRQYTWLDYYFPNQTSEEARIHRLHTDVLRQAILCRADISLFTLQWSEGQRMPRADFSHEHQCVDWESLDAWAAERAIPDSKMLQLKHPWHGEAFPEGKGNWIGGSEDRSPVVHE